MMGDLNNLEVQMRLMLFLIENADSYTVQDQVWAAESEEEVLKLYQDSQHPVLRAVGYYRLIGFAAPNLEKGLVRGASGKSPRV